MMRLLLVLALCLPMMGAVKFLGFAPAAAESSTCCTDDFTGPATGDPPDSAKWYIDGNVDCTGSGTPYSCCSDTRTGTCDETDCTADVTPWPCCTGVGTGTCEDTNSSNLEVNASDRVINTVTQSWSLPYDGSETNTLNQWSCMYNFNWSAYEGLQYRLDATNSGANGYSYALRTDGSNSWVWRYCNNPLSYNCTTIGSGATITAADYLCGEITGTGVSGTKARVWILSTAEYATWTLDDEADYCWCDGCSGATGGCAAGESIQAPAGGNDTDKYIAIYYGGSATGLQIGDFSGGSTDG